MAWRGNKCDKVRFDGIAKRGSTGKEDRGVRPEHWRIFPFSRQEVIEKSK